MGKANWAGLRRAVVAQFGLGQCVGNKLGTAAEACSNNTGNGVPINLQGRSGSAFLAHRRAGPALHAAQRMASAHGDSCSANATSVLTPAHDRHAGSGLLDERGEPLILQLGRGREDMAHEDAVTVGMLPESSLCTGG